MGRFTTCKKRVCNTRVEFPCFKKKKIAGLAYAKLIGIIFYVRECTPRALYCFHALVLKFDIRGTSYINNMVPSITAVKLPSSSPSNKY